MIFVNKHIFQNSNNLQLYKIHFLCNEIGLYCWHLIKKIFALAYIIYVINCFVSKFILSL
jgi:hypothetical protein